MRRVTDEDRARSAMNWARKFLRLNKPTHQERRRAVRQWLMNVLGDWSPELESRIMRALSRMGAKKAALSRKRKAKREKAEAERKRQGDLFKGD